MFKFSNPLQISWDFKKFIFCIILIQILYFASTFIDTGMKLDILKSIFGFIYITFVPGLLLLRIIKLNKLNSFETLLYSVGLSVASVMIIGISIDLLYPLIGIQKPLSYTSVIFSFFIFTLILSIISYVLDDGHSKMFFIDLNDYLSPPALFVYLIPFLSIIGTYLVNIYHTNILLMIMILAVSLVVLLVSFNKTSPKLYPLSIFVISIALLFHSSLISMNLVEWGDVSFEFFASTTILNNAIWLPSSITGNLNSSLTICLLTPIYSIFTGLEIKWLFKIVFPLIYALVPLGLYEVFKKQSNDKIAFLASFLFISTFSFFTAMLGLNRQQFGELFIVLVILLLLNRSMNQMKKTTLLILFAISMVVSHYALSNLFMLAIIIIAILLLLNRFEFVKKYTKMLNTNNTPSKDNLRSFTIGFTVLFIVFSMGWFIYTSNSLILVTITKLLSNIVSNFVSEFLNPSSVQGLDLIAAKSPSILGYIYKPIYLITQVFIVFGIFLVVFKRNKFVKIDSEFILLSIPFLIMDMMGVVVPYFASAINTSRLYHISLIFLSLFAVIGGLYTFKCLKFGKNAINALSIFLVVYFLFNVGFIYEVCGEHNSFPLNTEEKLIPHFTQNEVNSILWVKDKTDIKYNKTPTIYSDINNAYLIEMIFGKFNSLDNTNYIGRIQKNYYFVGKSNIKDNTLYLYSTSRLKGSEISFDQIEPYFNNKSKIYDGNTANIYY